MAIGLDKRSRLIRKSWLTQLWLGVLLFAVFFFVSFYLLKIAPQHPSKFVLSKLNAIQESTSSFIEGLIIVLPFFYFCNYKKTGTRLLTGTIIWSYFAIAVLSWFLFGAVLFYLKLRQLQAPGLSWHLWAMRFTIVFSIVEITRRAIWLRSSKKMKRLNILLQLTELAESPTYKAIVDRFDEITDMDELTQFYSSSVRKHPEIEKNLTTYFREKKDRLVEISSSV